MSQPCTSCQDEARERNREMENLKAQAQIKASEDNKPKAICEDQVTGLFITDAQTAFKERFRIRYIVSGLSQVNAG